jgi:hypothetical protein
VIHLLQGKLNVSDASNFTNSIHTNSNLDVSGNTMIDGSLTVNGITTLNGSIINIGTSNSVVNIMGTTDSVETTNLEITE